MKNELYKYNKDSLSYEKVSFKKVYGLPMVLILIISLFLGAEKHSPTVIEKLTPFDRLIVIDEETKFTRDKLIIEIGNMNFKHPEIVLAQATLETGNFTSLIFQENHNMFGMKLPKTRATKAVGTNRGHATFENWEDSLDDYAMYYNAYLKSFNEEKYYQFLNKFYAEDPSYVTKVRKLANKFKDDKVFWHYKDKDRS